MGLEYMLEPHLLCLGFRIAWDHVLELHHPPLLAHLHPHPHLPVLQVMDVDLPNGKEMDIVMMKTTMTAVTMMVEIVAVTMSTPHIVLPDNVLILILEVMIAVKMIAKTSNPQPGVKKRRENVTSLELPKIVQKLVSAVLV